MDVISAYDGNSNVGGLENRHEQQQKQERIRVASHHSYMLVVITAVPTIKNSEINCTIYDQNINKLINVDF